MAANHDLDPFTRLRNEAGEASLDRIESLLTTIHAKVDRMSTTLDAGLGALTSDVAALKTTVEGATVAFQGLQAKIAAGIASATASGATPDQLAELTALDASLQSETASLAAAVASVGDPDTSTSTTSL